MADKHIHLPPMPTPEDFGITKETWRISTAANGGVDAAGAQAAIAAYKEALAAWQAVASQAGRS
jgi:hypothetical protein